MLHILGVGYYHPEYVIDNNFIESLDLGTDTQWIMDKIGIRTRVTTLPLEYIRDTRNQDPEQAAKVASISVTEMGARAARMAIERAGISPSDIGLVICDCSTLPQLVPAEAQRVAKALELRVPAYDVTTACPAFALQVNLINNTKEETLPDYVLCVTTASLTHSVNYNDRTDAAILSDGAAAWVMSAKHPGKLRVLASSYTTDPLRCDCVAVERFGHFHQDGRLVRDFSVRQTVRLIKEMENNFEIDWARDIFIGHQANATMLQQIINNRQIPASNHWHNVEEYGNQAAAGAPATLGMHWEDIRPGMKILISLVGAGLSWGSVLLEGA